MGSYAKRGLFAAAGVVLVLQPVLASARTDVDLAEFRATIRIEAPGVAAPKADVRAATKPGLVHGWLEEVVAGRGQRLLGIAPTGFVNVLEITAYFRNRSSLAYLTDLTTDQVLLSNGNLHYRAPVLTWGAAGQTAQRLNILGPGETFKVVFAIGLRSMMPFQFYVNICGRASYDVGVAFDEYLQCRGVDRVSYPRSVMVPLGPIVRNTINAIVTPPDWARLGFIDFVPGNSSIATTDPAKARYASEGIAVSGGSVGATIVEARTNFQPQTAGLFEADVKPVLRRRIAIHVVTDPTPCALAPCPLGPASSPPAALIPRELDIESYLDQIWRVQANIITGFTTTDRIVRSDMTFAYDVNGNGRFDGDGPGSAAEWNRINTAVTAEGDFVDVAQPDGSTLRIPYIHVFYVKRIKDDTAWTDMATRRIVIGAQREGAPGALVPSEAISLLYKTLAHEVGHALGDRRDTRDPLELMFYSRRWLYAHPPDQLDHSCSVRKLDWCVVNPTAAACPPDRTAAWYPAEVAGRAAALPDSALWAYPALQRRIEAGDATAILELGRANDSSVLPYLEALARQDGSDHGSPQAAARMALARMGVGLYFQQMLADVDAADPMVQDQAVEKLAYAGNAEALAKLISLLDRDEYRTDGIHDNTSPEREGTLVYSPLGRVALRALESMPEAAEVGGAGEAVRMAAWRSWWARRGPVR